MIALIDYGMGNLRSVENALKKVGADVRICTRPEEVLKADAVVLPGVGALGDCIQNLEQSHLDAAIRDTIQKGKPFLGICLGLQVLFEYGEENGGAKGLGIFAGKVPKFPSIGLKVPQIGWNSLNIVKKECPILKGISSGSYVYFVHSYYVYPEDDGLIAATTEYGVNYCSMIHRNNVFAVQFHPEKSQTVGLKMLENFVNFGK